MSPAAVVRAAIESRAGDDRSRAHALSLLSSAVLFCLLPWPSLPKSEAGDQLCCSAAPALKPAAPALGEPTPLPLPATPQRSEIVFGDHVKLSFLESVGIPVGRSGSQPGNVVATIFPRTDLSSERVVDDDGVIDVPKLGRFVAAGRTVPELQADLAGAFQRSFGRPCDVEVSIGERLPVYVVGDVRAPGVVHYEDGMIVLQVLASVGGPGSPPPMDSSRQIENVRETERLRQQKDTLDRLLVKQAMLAAQRQGLAEIKLPPDILARASGATGPTVLTGLVESASLTLAALRERSRTERELAQRLVTIARDDVEAHRRRAEQLRVNLAKKQLRLSELQAIARRGSVPGYNVLSMEIDVSDTSLRIEDEAIALAQAERRAVEATAALERQRLDAAAQLETEWAATLRDIAECNQSIQAIAAVVQITADPAGQASSRPAITITRRGRRGFFDLQASDSTALLPGDVVQVGAAGGGEPGRHDATPAKSSLARQTTP